MAAAIGQRSPSAAERTPVMNPYATARGALIAPRQSIIHSHFDVESHSPRNRLLAWRERVGHVIDVVPSLSDLKHPFSASIERYSVGRFVFTDCRSDAMWLDRSLARISKDSIRTFAFHVFLDGEVDNVAVHASQRNQTTTSASLLALHLGQPVRMRRSACRVLTLFAPVEVAAEIFPDPEAMHGRGMRNDSPLTRLIVEHVTELSRTIHRMDADLAEQSLRTGVELLVEAFGKQAGLRGNARAAKRAAMFGSVRRYIHDHLFDDSLTPDTVLDALQLPRPTLYRMFQHEGGLGAYIRHLRLRQAADDLAHRPHLSVTDIAYGTGFSSPSDFTRAFRRAYDIAPQDFRVASRETGHILTPA
ncbi:AraC family transcriptional regulator, positive regulator of tynA and feaB [Pararobbsia alpina]